MQQIIRGIAIGVRKEWFGMKQQVYVDVKQEQYIVGHQTNVFLVKKTVISNQQNNQQKQVVR